MAVDNRELDSFIEIVNARENNLASVSCRLPRNKFVAVSGPSGSGKSSLIFGTLYREAERRFYSTNLLTTTKKARHLPPPAVESITGMSFAVAVRPRRTPSAYETVATLSGLYEPLRTVFFYLGAPLCTKCQTELHAMKRATVIEEILKSYSEQTVHVLAPVGEVSASDSKKLSEQFIAQGFLQAEINGELTRLEFASEAAIKHTNSFSPLIDSILVSDSSRARLAEAVRIGMLTGSGNIIVSSTEAASQRSALYSEVLRCPDCFLEQAHAQEKDFLYYLPGVGCDHCSGRTTTEEPCPKCSGTRVSTSVQQRTFANSSWRNLLTIPIVDALSWAKSLQANSSPSSADKASLFSSAIADITERLEFLCDINLGYLSLCRSVQSLSSGESERTYLARALASKLHGVLYLLDEPTIGLHPEDIHRLLQILRRLRDAGNSLIVVDHSPELLEASDYLLLLGPGAGEHGGRIVASGITKQVLKEFPVQISLSTEGAVPRTPTAIDAFPKLTLHGASKHNLKSVTVSIPLQSLVAVTGVSGSGKTSLITKSLLPALQTLLAKRNPPPDWQRTLKADYQIERIEGSEHLETVVDSTEFARTSTARSIVATLIDVLTEFRTLFASTPDAKILGFTPQHFSFYHELGRCQYCQGAGEETVHIDFQTPITIPCEHCLGRRYNAQVESVFYRGQSISDVLALTAEQALEVFSKIPKIKAPLQSLTKLGLGYLKLIQSTQSLSLGELQRVRLVKPLTRKTLQKTLFIFDEPTRGLHHNEVLHLIQVLNDLIQKGASVIVIEHNPTLIRMADYIIDLGPGAGANGGNIVATGTPKEIAANQASKIAPYL